MRHDPAAGALVIMLRSLKMHGMAQAVDELAQQGAPAFEAAIPVLSQLLKAETAELAQLVAAFRLGSSGQLAGASRRPADPKPAPVRSPVHAMNRKIAASFSG